jgi:hypothetical protein
MVYVFLKIWPWILAALGLGAFTGIFAGRLSLQGLQPKRNGDAKKVVKETVPAPAPTPAIPSPTPEQIEALAKRKKEVDDQLSASTSAIADLRAGLDREVALRRAAIARLEGMLVDQQAQAPTRPIKGKASAKSSPSH